MYDYLLPLGTIVLLKDGKKAMMITGYLQGTRDGTVFDYAAVTYPEGFIDARLQIVFNHSRIEKILFKGYEDNHGEKDAFIQYLNLRMKRKVEHERRNT